MKAPFPYFGGKSKAAAAVWAALGDVAHYVEPFCGSAAVLLRRPHVPNRPGRTELVNDADGLLVNAWRGIQLRPEETAEAASWLVSEADLHARHLALIEWRERNNLESLLSDPSWCDPVMAGWWLWGASIWVGGRWCLSRPKTPNLPDISGKGVTRSSFKKPGLRAPRVMPGLVGEITDLSARLRHVAILNGDWSRAVTSGIAGLPKTYYGATVGVFLDPPYGDDARRERRIYSSDSLTVADDVRAWCLTNGDDPQYRIVLAGFDVEHAELEAHGWRCAEWYTPGGFAGGMGNIAKTPGPGGQQHRERLWLSPHCLTDDATPTLFDLETTA